MLYRPIDVDGEPRVRVHAGVVTPLMHDFTVSGLRASTAYEICLGLTSQENADRGSIEDVSCVQVRLTYINNDTPFKFLI